ncbi:acyl-CoA dehydrogenase [Leptotrichia sp. OH3620_COT-345]|uniref:acyl-CoA dehydrogenase family protein n=1 Tax=Leptotrichia sp. OH3620_COT-345 TaxID=2491048 RepID=UPI000F6460DD|nr:acyl-CoA dehydrogenase family protein [Leptotrichia sp. OH3620_COT-345]RRD40913.1 acyl-CoA dehydrogenase [Leptotrichia sp. OH3620_COT-345]
MLNLIDEALVKMNTNEFLNNIKKAFNDIFSAENMEKINLMNYLPEDKWLYIKKHGLLLPFLTEKFGGRKANQFEIQEVLRIAGNYGVPVTLRTGIEGALVLQPLTEFGNSEQITKGLELIFNGEGGGLAITEPETSGSAIAKEMQSYYEYVDENTVRLKSTKYWQGNSQSDFLLVAAKEKKDGRISKAISLIFVPKKYIKYDVLKSEGLKAVRYAVNKIDALIPSKYIIQLSDSRANSLREFQNIFIRSRLQLIGMTHGIMEYILKNIKKYSRSEIKFVEREIEEIRKKYAASQVLYNYTCNNISPDKSVADKLMEANIIKSLSTDYTYEAAKTAQKLLGAKGFEYGHPMSNIAIDFRPFTIFEGPNDMLYAEIYDQFSKATAEEKKMGVKINKELTIYDRFISDKRFKVLSVSTENIIQKIDDIISFMKKYSLNEIDQIKKVFTGKIISKLFVLIQTELPDLSEFLIKDIKKDILDFEYC